MRITRNALLIRPPSNTDPNGTRFSRRLLLAHRLFCLSVLKSVQWLNPAVNQVFFMNLQVQKKKKTLDSNYCAAVCLFLDDRRRQCWSHTFSLADGAQWRSNHTQLQYNAGGPLLLYPRINTCNSNVTHFHPAPQEHRYFRSADLRSSFFSKSSLLQTLSILLISSYLIPNASWWCWWIDW